GAVYAVSPVACCFPFRSPSELCSVSHRLFGIDLEARTEIGNMQSESEQTSSLARFLAINRTVGIVLIAVLFFGLGEELWSQFMPVYLEAQGKQAAHEAAVVGVSGRVLWTVGVYA